MNRCSPAEDAATARMVAAMGMVQVNVTTLNRPPRMKAPPTPDLCFPVSEPVSHDGRVISYSPKSEKVNQRNKAATAMFTRQSAAKLRAPAAPTNSENRKPIDRKSTR